MTAVSVMEINLNFVVDESCRVRAARPSSTQTSSEESMWSVSASTSFTLCQSVRARQSRLRPIGLQIYLCLGLCKITLPFLTQALF